MVNDYLWLMVDDYLWLMVDDYLWLMVRKYLSAWWGPYLTYPSEIHDGVSNSWDDDMPNMMGKIKAMFQTTNQYILYV